LLFLRWFSRRAIHNSCEAAKRKGLIDVQLIRVKET